MKRTNKLFSKLFSDDLKRTRFETFAGAILVLALSSCGGTPSGPTTPTGIPNSALPNSNPNPVATSIPVVTPTVPAQNTTSALPPAITASFTLQGTRGTAPTGFFTNTALKTTTTVIPSISTDNRLIVTLVPNPTVTIQNLDTKTETGCMVQTSCQQVIVKLIDATTNQPIGVGLTLSATQSPGGTGTCGSQPAVPTAEFSAASVSGHRLFNLEVSQVSSVVASMSCSSAATSFFQGLNLNYFTWIQSGSLKIQTSSTQ